MRYNGREGRLSGSFRVFEEIVCHWTRLKVVGLLLWGAGSSVETV